MRKALIIITLGLLTIFTLLFLLLTNSKIIDFYNSNFKYSIATPIIIGQFDIDGKWIDVKGVENIINDDIATLNINETTCSLKFMECIENRVVISGLGNQISIFPYNKEYKIKYADRNKIIFSEKYPMLQETSGEIDLNSKTLIYTVKNAGINRNETRKIEVITDNAQIQELEKKIISKYLRKRMFER